MNAFDTVRQCASNVGVPIYKIGLSMGKTRQYMSAMFSRGSTPKADTLARMLNVCGYGLYACPLDKPPKNGIEITANDD